MRLAQLLCLALPLTAQPLRVYSELARIDASGEVAAPTQPREILSPAIARNAFTSFQVVVQVPQGTHYWLHIGQNPDDAARIALYRETGDRLEPVEIPYGGDSTQVFWLDVWTDRDAPVRRIKIEPQLNVADDWVVYPMEVRVVDATVPEGQRPDGSATPVSMMKSFVCGTKVDAPPAPASSVARLRFRNAQQDLALASHPPSEGLRKLIGRCDAALPEDPEWYLRIRDYLFRMR